MQRKLLSLVLVAVLALAGCVGTSPDDVGAQSSDAPDVDAADPGNTTRDVLPDEITGFEPLGVVETEAGGNGLWIDHDDDLLFATSGGGGLTIANVSDPANPEVLSVVSDRYARDVDVMERDDGRRIAVLAGGGNGITLMDATDPTAPEVLSTTELPGGTTAHNIAVVPGTGLIYNSGAGDAIYGLDASEPEDPALFSFPIPNVVDGTPVTSDGCHDVTVRTDLGLAFCAGAGSRYGQGGGETFIWDISHDPTDPVWLSLIDDPRIFYHHQALANAAGDVLVIDDEHIAPNCVREETPMGPDAQVPTGAVWFYDISDPANPVQMSHLQRPTPDDGPRQNCGSHFGDMVGDRDVLAMGWYQGGTMLVDFSEPADPTILDVAPPVGSTWDARYHEGHIYTGSGNVQVLEII